MKRSLAVTLVLSIFLALLTGLTGCSREGAGKNDKAVTLKVWGAQEDQKMLEDMIKKFKDSRKDDGKTYTITLGVVGEKDTKTKFLEDPKAAADVFAFPDDQMNDLLAAGALYEVTRNKQAIIDANLDGAVDAASSGDKLYAYPMTADNGYFLYYDSRVLSADDVKTLDGLLAAANKAGKRMYMDVSNGYYVASFFLGAGCTLGLNDKGKQTCDFNNDNGVKAGEAVKALCADKAFITGDDAVLTGGIGDTICAGVSGTWNADAVKDKLGDHYAAAKLPTFTMDGKQVQMGSFAGYKLLGVNSGTKYPVEAMDLAEFLTNEESQLERFRTRAMGPSNRKAADSEEVKKNVALAALAAQNQHGTSQKNVLGTFYDPAEAFGLAMETKNYSKSVKDLLDSMVAQITS